MPIITNPTVASLREASFQDIFDTAWTLLSKQGKPSVDPKIGNCLYRAPDGSKCAIGHFIEDEKYSPDMENHALDSTIMNGVLMLNSMDCMDRLAFLERLQTKHDFNTIAGPSEWLRTFRREMLNLAFSYNLDISVMESDQ